jgi:hypothetical protein
MKNEIWHKIEGRAGPPKDLGKISVALKNRWLGCQSRKTSNKGLLQGILTERDGSVQLTSLYKQV